MRPPVPDIAPPRVRKPSFDQPPSDPRIVTPATFFLARSSSPDSEDNAEASQDSMYGVQSLDDAINQATLAESRCDSDLSAESGIKLSPNPANDTLPLPLHDGVVVDDDDDDDDDGHEDYREAIESARRKSTLKAFDFDSASLQPPPSDSELSRPLSPLNLSNPDDHPPSSLPSSPKSLSSHSIRPLDDISITDEQSQAVISGEEDNEGQDMPVMGNDSMPQLIMPSLRMPSRRPFTERGKGMGRLKVVIAGASGSGKTSLIKSIVQECEDIVHVDPFPPILSSRRRRSSRSQAQAHGARPAVSEIYASTKPYPSWWSDLEDTRVLRRKRSMDDIVLERNLCFVDTPATSISRAEQTDAILHYVHQQLYRAIAAFDSPNGDFRNMLAGNGGSQVDAIIYLISQDTLAADVECIQKLCKFTNVVPVIAKSDFLSSDQIAGLKVTFQKQAQAANVKPFLFEDPPLGETGPRVTQVPFAVSSAKSSDDDVMDASTLMSPEYVQPLVASELGLLVQNLFDRDHLAWMRHSAAKKLAQRQRAQLAVQPYVAHSPSSSIGSPSMSSNPSISSINSLTPALTGPLDYTLARIADHTQREERLAQVHLASWASDLQQSLQNERQRYAAMARGDRAVWLTERLSECVVDGSLVPITQTPGFGGLHVSPSSKAIGKRHRKGAAAYHISRLSPHDPLGVVWWTDDLKHRGWAILQIVGSFGVVGGLALWIARFWGLQSKNIAENLPWCSAIRA